jgi:thiosulfate dehydrogenase [quinone] large subunit
MDTVNEQLDQPKQRAAFSSWRLTGIGLLRIVFGLIWAVDAWFKWQPDFIHNFNDYLTGAQQDQPAVVQSWIGFWIDAVKVDPHVFAYLVAIGETAIAVALILGVFSNVTNLVGVAMTLIIWSTAEGFGGPYQAGSTDIGSAVIYALVFVGLYLSQSGLYLGLDRRLTPALGRFGFLASGPMPRET